MYKGGKRGDGSNASQTPVQTEQPHLDYEQFQSQAQSIAMHIMAGVISPASLGIDVSKKDNADAQREKEKVTIFTREAIMAHLGPVIVDMCKQLLDVNTYLVAVQECLEAENPNENDSSLGIEWHDFEVACQFDSFADTSFENKLTALGNALSVDAISPELYVEKLYGDTLSEEQKKKEVDYITERKNPQGDMMEGFGDEQPVEGEEPLTQEGDEVSNEESKDVSESDMTNFSYNRNNG